MPSVVIAGGGLVGALNACFFAKRGWEVEVYELRPDIRQMEHFPGRTLNLALSFRGKAALEAVGLHEYIEKQGVEMHARLVHEVGCKSLNRQPYGLPGEHIVSMNRRHLNEVMIEEAEKTRRVTFFFQHKVKGVDLVKNELIISNNGMEKRARADLVIGCDGAHSAVRRSLMTQPSFNYSQEYIEHGYIELSILPKNNQFAMEPNVFHLWPRGSFCLIALPNRDKTFTVNLFASFATFESKLSDREGVLSFFRKHFSDALDLITESVLAIGVPWVTAAYLGNFRERVAARFEEARPQTLISLKCSPHHFGTGCVLSGDAAHAMVPFYGQGMNCGFEDCLVLNEILDECNEDIKSSLALYSERRVVNAQTCNDLSMYNYSELRNLVNHASYKLRQKLDLLLTRSFGPAWLPLYSMVSFTRLPYFEITETREWQDRVLSRIGWLTAIGFVAILLSLFSCRIETITSV